MGLRELFRAWASPQVYRYDTNEDALRGLNDSQLAAIIESRALYDAQGREGAQRELEARKSARGSEGFGPRELVLAKAPGDRKGASMAGRIGRALLIGVGCFLLAISVSWLFLVGEPWGARLLVAAVCATLGAPCLWLAFRERGEQLEGLEEALLARLVVGATAGRVQMPRGDPVCTQCGTVYNRGPVIRELKKLDPLAFRFGGWSLKFKCQRCGAVIMISGTSDEA
jgi:hypothetical protein